MARYQLRYTPIWSHSSSFSRSDRDSERFAALWRNRAEAVWIWLGAKADGATYQT
ncbi:MAG: hypothetical protein Q8O95_02900 [bacterium]|nr:hypothetical protein [bacterium]